MKLIIKCIFLFSFLFCASNLLFAQDVGALPNDPRVKTGKLPNGLTYYVVKNSAIKGQADFCIVQKVGTTLEEPQQEGMFKMLELLATKGTRNFIGSSMTQYLNSIGIDNNELQFKTEKEDLNYLIKNVPVSRANVLDSTLLILYNWLGSINIDEEDIVNTMPTFRNAIADQWNAQKRVESALLRDLYPQSNYGKELKPDMLARMQTYSSKDLRTFYYKWCRPDLQAVFVVGDVDLVAVENKIKSVFSIIPKPPQNVDRKYFNPDKFEGIKVIIEKDIEYNKTNVSINLLKTPLLAKYRNTTIPYIQEYFSNALTSLLLSRLQTGSLSENLPITNITITSGNFMGVNNQDAFSINFETRPQALTSSVAFVSQEIGRLAKYGFNHQEFTNSRDKFYRELEYIYDNRTNLNNDIFLNRALNNYMYGYTLASIEMNFQVMKDILFSLSLKDINSYTSSVLGQKDNILISCFAPQTRRDNLVAEDVIKKSFTDGYNQASSGTHYVEPNLINWPNFAQTGTQSTITSQISDPIFGTEVITLSNGATVVLKTTDTTSNNVSFMGVSKGGISQMGDIEIGNRAYLNEIINLGGLGNISLPLLEKMLSYSNIDFKSSISRNTEQMTGSSDAENAEKLFHLINLSMTSRRADEVAFDVFKESKISEAQFYNLSPRNIFEDTVMFYNRSNRAFSEAKSVEAIQKLEYPQLLFSSRERFANAGDFVFIFVGDINKERFVEYAKKYIGSIPGNGENKESWMVLPNYLTKGKYEHRFLYQMVIPRSYISINLSHSADFNVKTDVLSKLTTAYLDNVYNNGSIKNLSSSSSIESSLKYYPEEVVLYESLFDTDSIGINSILNIFDQTLKDLSNNRMDTTLFNNIKKGLKDSFTLNEKSTDYWLSILENRYVTGEDFYSEFNQTLDNITPLVFSQYIKELYEKGNKVTVIMEGTTENTRTRNLLKGNDFIRNYFE